ncbi:MAG TPA: M20/M25/M40 family metallo-hydrolase [Chloroflexi bacterium]|nr:M20/M25/M40 family metallo-hydrolase [Chloroflexota bacterium]
MGNQDIYQRPVELLQTLIRFDTTNPPGNEIECITYIRSLIEDAGLQTTVLARDENRPNLIARLPGRGDAPPLLLQGHVDVVTTADQAWDHPPFSGEIVDGMVWGRGAIDMKGGVAMMLSAFLRARAEGLTPAGDIILTLVSDEEAGGRYGAKYLVENHAALFEGVRYAIGEGGGVALTLGGRKFYTIMVAEKQLCPVRVTVRGPAGHGSMPIQGGAMAKLADVLHTLDRKRLPVHITPAARLMLETVSRALPFPDGLVLRGLLNPLLTDLILDMLGSRARLLNPTLHNTASPTIVRGGNKINVLPSEITLDLDGRLLPGFGPDDMLRELHGLLGDEVELEILGHDPGPPDPDMGLYDMLADILREADPEGTPMPFLLAGVTDARFFARLGIQTYGFLPMDIPGELINTVHAANERLPVEAVGFGAEAIYTLLQRYGAS